MAFELPVLPYPADALQPHMSAETFSFHHGKHHAAYINNLNAAIQGTDLADKTLEEIVLATAQDPDKVGIFNNAAQTWNHTFFWGSMKPNGGGAPTGAIADKITADFGSYDAFKEAFKKAATTQFGSGWAWLVLDQGTLKITKTGNAGNPITDAQVPLLTLDVWEHAYYLDYQNRRPDYIETYLNHLVNWDAANERMAGASA